MQKDMGHGLDDRCGAYGSQDSADMQTDLNSRQVEAAPFAFRLLTSRRLPPVQETCLLVVRAVGYGNTGAMKYL